MKPELEYLITEAGPEAVTDLLRNCKRVSDAEPFIRQLYPVRRDPLKKEFRRCFSVVMWARRDALTDSESQVVEQLCRGQTQKGAAVTLGMSVNAIVAKCRSICSKLNANNMLHAVAILAKFPPEEKL